MPVLGVRSSKSLRVRQQVLILIQIFCPIFYLLILASFREARGQHRVLFGDAPCLLSFSQRTCPNDVFLRKSCFGLLFNDYPSPTTTGRVEESRRYQELAEVAGYGIEAPGIGPISDEEAERAGIPVDPRWVALIEENLTCLFPITTTCSV